MSFLGLQGGWIPAIAVRKYLVENDLGVYWTRTSEGGDSGVGTYTRETVSQVLSAIDIANVVGAAVELKPAGSGRLKGLCPFHTEKTPSFTVSRPRQMYHCFGCGKGGDALDFLQEYEGLTFPDALRRLADQAGVRLPALTERDDASERLREQLFAFGKFAAKHFLSELREPLRGSEGRKYIQSRSLREETVQQFGLGYAPDEWTRLLDAVRTKGFDAKVLEASGLFRTGERGGTYDFFRHRVMFPIRDLSGNIVAFGGRDLGDSPAKYINSPETAVYKKSRVLYGLFEAREAMRREKRALLVEGYFDLLRLFDAGIQHAVATCGTALTPEQATLVRRYVPEVVMVYDGDAAGIRAAVRGSGILAAAGLTVRAMALPEGQDPDDFVKAQGAEAFLSLVENAVDFVTFYVRMSQDRAATIEGRTEIAQEVFEILRTIEDELRRDEYLKRLAHELRLNEQLCRMEFQKNIQGTTKRRPEPVKQKEDASAELKRDDCLFIAALLAYGSLLQEVKKSLENGALPDGPLGTVLAAVLEAEGRGEDVRLDTEEARRLFAAAAATECGPEPEVREMALKRVNRIRRDAVDARAARLDRAIQEAERGGDQERMQALFAERIALARAKEQVGAS